MAAVGELLLSALFDALVDRLASRDFINFVSESLVGVYSELKKWENTLRMIQAVLKDAEKNQLTDDSVTIWLDNLRDLAYDAEDVLDEFATEVSKRKLTLTKVQNLINPVNPNTILFNSSMRSKIKSITARLEELSEEKNKLGLQLTPGRTSSSTEALRRPPSSSVPTERVVYGRDEDKAKILELVLSDEPSDANFRVIPIVGMIGIGKTTLVREVYNDKVVEDDDSKFDIKAWVCVSDRFDVLTISKIILESMTFMPCDLMDLNYVQIQLRNTIEGKKFLLVLDDVWNEDYSLWETVKAPFKFGAPGSMILLTSRHNNVASTMGTVEPYNLKCLLDDDCWLLFVDHAFKNDRDRIDGNMISDFRKKIVAKCGGLPLVAKTLGTYLGTKHRGKLKKYISRKTI